MVVQGNERLQRTTVVDFLSRPGHDVIAPTQVPLGVEPQVCRAKLKESLELQYIHSLPRYKMKIVGPYSGCQARSENRLNSVRDLL